MKQNMKFFEAPKAVMAEYLQAPGGRFWGNGTYSGQNRWHAAMLSVLVNKDTTKADTSKKQYIMSKDSIKIEIFNDRAEHIRTLKYKIEDGLNRLWWNLDRKSIRMPWQEKSENDDTEYNGMPIYPSVYKAVVTHQLTKDSQNIEVVFDPRMNFDRAGFEAKMTAFQDFSKRIELSREVMDRIRESKKIIDVIERQFTLQTDKEVKKKIDEQTKAIKDSIKTIEEFFSGPSGKKGIYRNPNNLQDNINDYSYILASHDRPNSNTDNILKLIDKQSKIFVEKWNKFNSIDWENYKKFIAEQKSTLFKDYDKIEWKE